jgi:RND family efflux transporter MFP subunit
VAGALSIAAIVLALWPTTLRVVAPARVEGVGQRVIAAPVDGFVQAVSLRPGEAVKAGQVLVTLEDRDLALERAKWTAEASQLDKQYREALTKDDAAQIVIARSKLEQAQAQLDLVALQIERAQLKAPFDGVLISGDLSQSVGMPVKRGQELMTVAPDKSFRIVAEVDEQDIGQLRTGQRARVMFAALVERPMTMALTRVAPVATPLEGRNVFEVDGRLEGSDQALRHGLRGVVRIEIEDSTYGAVWWQRASQWLQRTSWRVLG